MGWGASFTPTGGWYGDAIAKPGGGSYTRTDITNLRTRFYAYGNSTQVRQIRVDQFLVRVAWSYIAPTLVQTDPATNIGTTTATLNATLNSNGDGGGQYRIAYGTATGNYNLAPGWSANVITTQWNPAPNITSLSPNTTYYFRIEYQNSGTTQTNGAERSFTTLASTKGSRMMMMG
jgi:hypothetical protein